MYQEDMLTVQIARLCSAFVVQNSCTGSDLNLRIQLKRTALSFLTPALADQLKQSPVRPAHHVSAR